MEKQNAGVILGVDFGLKRVGIAISDRNRQIASPLTTIAHKSLSRTADEIQAICTKHQVSLIILGLPDSGSMIYNLVKSLQVKLLRRLSITPVETVNEAITTWQAQQFIRQKNLKKHKEHEIAATIILQRYIDESER